MKTLNKSLFATLALSAALALTGCGGGDSKRDDTVPQGFLPGGNNPVGTCGDGVNLNEYNAINGSMNREQIIAITCDQPTYILPPNGGSAKVETLQWVMSSELSVSVDISLRKRANGRAINYSTDF